MTHPQEREFSSCPRYKRKMMNVLCVLCILHSDNLCVAVVEGGPVGKPLWLVEPEDSDKVKHTHAGGREIHIMPNYIYPPFTAPVGKTRSLPISQIDCRSFVSAHAVESIREAFPGAVGFQIWFSGWCILLFPNNKSMGDSWKHGTPAEIGGLRVGYGILECNRTADRIENSISVSSRPSDYAQSASLGLRLHMPCGTDVITTVSHAFVQLPDEMSRVKKKYTDIVLYFKSRIQESRLWRQNSIRTAMVQGQDSGNSPLGKRVWMAGTDTQIGIITTTYDSFPRSNNRQIPYPYGFEHDLSLITSDRLPQMMSPIGSPNINGWAPYEEALAGNPVFLYRHNVFTGNHNMLAGRGGTGTEQEAIVSGTQYPWERRSRKLGTSLLWRTAHDGDDLTGASGSVLCLGKPTDPYVRALLFQNYEGKLVPDKGMKIPAHIRKNDRATFKAGFLLPEEIRQSEIVTANAPQPMPFRSVGSRGSLVHPTGTIHGQGSSQLDNKCQVFKAST